jgi:hypothetical protein
MVDGLWGDGIDELRWERIEGQKPFGEDSIKSKQQKRRDFVKGPLPMEWIIAGHECPNLHALPVLLMIKMRADSRRAVWVSAPPLPQLRKVGVNSRQARSVVLHVLERNGLIRLARQPGHTTQVRLVPWFEVLQERQRQATTSNGASETATAAMADDEGD